MDKMRSNISQESGFIYTFKMLPYINKADQK